MSIICSHETNAWYVHPAASLFPLMGEEELNELAEDIRINGLREPVILIEVDGDSLILDGRNRVKACKRLRIARDDIRTETITTDDPMSYVVSRNLHRHHLTTKERAEIAAKLVTTKVGAPLGNSNASNDVIDSRPSRQAKQVSIKEAAKRLTVSPASVDRATKRIKNGTPQPQVVDVEGKLKRRPDKSPKSVLRQNLTKTLALAKYWREQAEHPRRWEEDFFDEEEEVQNALEMFCEAAVDLFPTIKEYVFADDIEDDAQEQVSPS